ncbi:MAG: tRNA preQ1(34) S-adenosylmethionine ribosyltransferase-isomerase QueA [Chloroflexi bacterium]|nr:tRNA preQ1(34) S-adenosylmethionine ribosyltransferase-isomerase QueA [Chloroflexota bacterium]
MRLEDFDYHLQEERIAQHPLHDRDSSLLLHLKKDTSEIIHRKFHEFPDLPRENDLLVMNDTRVIPARLFGKRESTGGRVEIFLVRELKPGTWITLARPGRRLKAGAKVGFENGLSAAIDEVLPEGERIVTFSPPGSLWDYISKHGTVPLPPYIKADLSDPERYQTVYSISPGAVAAPTAGLHFTPKILEKIKNRNIETATVTLHVGPGTFRPVSADEIDRHVMDEEFYNVPEETGKLINSAVKEGRRIVAVGTTTVRTLESAFDTEGNLVKPCGGTRLFIYPGYRFKIINSMLTNFHLPKSTLIMLVSALAGRDNIMKAYNEAIERDYRFYSFGDAMFIE